MLCLATATHILKWLKITDMCLLWWQTSANLNAKTLISFQNGYFNRRVKHTKNGYSIV